MISFMNIEINVIQIFNGIVHTCTSSKFLSEFGNVIVHFQMIYLKIKCKIQWTHKIGNHYKQWTHNTSVLK